MAVAASLRSLLFVPGSDERKLLKALGSDADGVIADLEDGVAPAEKEAARSLVRRVLAEAETRCALLVRVNGVGTSELEDDLAAVEGLPLDGLVLPKAAPEAVALLGDGGPPLLALVETASGLRQAYEIASAPRVEALMLGAADLGAELRLEPREDGLELLHARSQLVLDSAAARVRPPFDGVCLATHDKGGLAAEARLARSLGMGGKACIHPAQVGVVNEVFAPTGEQVAWAKQVVEAYERGQREGRGAVALNGSMVDLPVVERARQVLAEAERSAG
jgi:citrate lyase beta subunit